MPRWLEYLLNNPAAYADFIAWLKSAEAELHKKLAKSVQDDKIEEARGLSHELQVYENIRNFAERQLRERTAQNQYAEQFEGRQ
jgi:hypothetical protein